MKPKITYERSIIYKCKQWFCRGGGVMGIGITPDHAYWDWRYFCKKHGIKGGA